MSLEQLTTLEEMRAFLAGTQAVVFAVATDKKARYQMNCASCFDFLANLIRPLR